MSDDGGSDENGCSLPGFLNCVLGDGPRFWLLIAFLVVLTAVYARSPRTT